MTGCATTLGDRRQFFTTHDTVEDLEALRVALKADKLTLDGISYGTYTAQRYALAYPRRVKALVLDSVVPAEGSTMLVTTQMKATGRVLGPETTKALAKVVRDHGNGPELLDMLTALSVGAPRDDGYIDAIRQAASGDDAALRALAERRRQVRAPLDRRRSSARACTPARCARTGPRRGATRRPR